MRTRALVAILAGSLLAAPSHSADRVERALRDHEPVRTRLIAAIDQNRERQGLAPVSPDRALTRAAQEVVLEIARQLKTGESLEDALDQDELNGRIAAAGYEPDELAILVSVHDGEPPEVAAWLMATGRTQLRQPHLRDVGIGIAPSWRSRIYLVVAARSTLDRFTAETADLEALEEIRAQLLASINSARRGTGAGRLEPESCLEQVAQAYAERMLAGGFFGHASPEGEEALERVRARRCPHRSVGEALAKGHTDVDAVIAEWLASDDHRTVLLEKGFDEIGVGLALGRGPEGYDVVWVVVVGNGALAGFDG